MKQYIHHVILHKSKPLTINEPRVVRVRELIHGNYVIPALFSSHFKPNLHCFQLGEAIER